MRKGLLGLGIRGVLPLVVVAGGAAGCGLRVDVPERQASAAPAPTTAKPGGAATSAPAGTSAPASTATTATTTAAPTTTAKPTTTTAAPTTSTTKAAAFDKAAFCADVKAAPIKDITGFATVDKAKAKQFQDLFARIEKNSPPDLVATTKALDGPVQQLTQQVLDGKITTVPDLQAAINALGPGLATWIQAQRDTIAWTDTNC